MNDIVTVLGSVKPEDLGHCQPHEHIYITQNPVQLTEKNVRFTILPLSIQELKSYKKAGGTTLVEAMPVATGRDALALATASRESHVNIIACTGFHASWLYKKDHWIHELGELELCDLFVRELREGMGLGGCYEPIEYWTKIRAGAIKAAYFPGYINERQKVLLKAAAQASKITDAPVILHTEGGKGALECTDVLLNEGMSPQKLLVCHTDWNKENKSLQIKLASMGVFISFDAINTFQFIQPLQELDLIRSMIENGFGDRITLSTDPTIERLKAYGGKVGIDYVLTEFYPFLKNNGISDDLYRIWTRENTKKLFTLNK